MRKSMYIFVLLFISLSCNNKTSSSENPSLTEEAAATAHSDSMSAMEKMNDTTTPGAGITAAEVIIEVMDTRTNRPLTDADVTINAGDNSVNFNPTDVEGKYFTMDDLDAFSRFELNVRKDGYAPYKQTFESKASIPTQIKLSAAK